MPVIPVFSLPCGHIVTIEALAKPCLFAAAHRSFCGLKSLTMGAVPIVNGYMERLGIGGILSWNIAGND